MAKPKRSYGPPHPHSYDASHYRAYRLGYAAGYGKLRYKCYLLEREITKLQLRIQKLTNPL